MLTGLIRDVKAGAQQLIRRPGFAAAALLSLALGVGVNTTLFSVVNAVLFRETVVTGRDRLVEIYTGINEDFPQLTSSYPDYLDIRAGADALAGVAASGYVRGILSGERPALVTGEAVTANYFDVLGIRLPLGRSFHEDENRVPNAAAVAIVSHGLWQRRFGGQSTVIGQPIELSGLRYTVIGVAPQGFMGTLPGIPADVWVPTMMVERLVFSGVQVNADNDPGTTRLDRRGSRWLFVKGRLATGRTVSEAQSQIAAIFARLQSQYPVTNDKVTVSVVPAASVRFHPMLDGYVRQASIVLMAAVGLVLLIACANVANLLLAQAVARRREFAIRAAIGASAGRIVRQLLSEGLVLAAMGGGLGILLAWLAGRLLEGLGTNVFPIPVSFDFTLDASVLTFAVIASLTTALLFGLAPAWSSSRPDISGTLKGAPGRTRRPVTLGDVLVCGQLALSLILLVAGALLGRGLLAARHTDIGFDPAPVSSLQFNLQMNGYDIDRASALRNEILRTIRALPGVVAASTASRLPLAPDINVNGIHVPGYHRAEDEEGTITDTVGVGADYFSTVGIPIVAGRAFTDADIAQHRRVAIINETMARHYWPDGSALGRLIHTAGFNSAPFEIVGIARDHKVRSVGEAPRSYLHLPDSPSLGVGLVVRTTVPAANALPMLRKAVWALEPNVLFTEDVPAVQVAATTMMPTRLGAMAAGAFGALALLLAAVGLHGLVTQSVRRRTREIGIRIALGARRGQVLRMILAQGGRLALIGVGLGALGAAAAGRVLESLLYGVSTFDPVAYGAAGGVLLLVATLANAKPAFMAATVDPVRALQHE